MCLNILRIKNNIDMKVIINIPKNKINGMIAMINMEGDLNDEQVAEIASTPEVDITEALKDEDSRQMVLALGLIAVGVIGEQKFPEL